MDLFQLAATLSLETGEFNRGLEDGRRRLSVYRHDVASLANEYRQQGMASSDAWKRAYQEIDKSEYGFVRESQDRWNETGGVIQKVSGTVSAGAVALGHLLADVAKKGAQMVVDLGKTGISYNAQMQDYTASFKTMLGSTEAAAAKVEALKEFAAKTPFEMTDLAQATQTLLAFGIEADKTDGIMKMLGDVSLGNSQKFASLATVFGQVSSTGKLMGQDLLQFINQGFNPLQVIAEKTGASMGDLKKVMSGEKTSREFQKMIKAAQKEVKKMGDNASESAKLLAQIGTDGAISAEMVEEAFRIATSEGGQFYNGMEESSKTLNGLFSTLSDNWTALVGDVFKPASDFLQTTLLPKAIEGVEKLSEAYNENGLKGMLGAAADLIAPYVEKAFSALSNIAGNAVTMGANIIAGIYNGLTGSEITAEDVKLVFSQMWDSVSGFAQTVVDSGSSVIGDIYTALTGDAETGEKIKSTIKGIFEDPLGTVQTIASSAGAFFTTVYEALTGDTQAQENIKEVFTTVFSEPAKIIQGVIDKGKAILEEITSVFTDQGKRQELLLAIRGAFAEGVAFIASLPGLALEWGKSLIDNFIRGLIDKWNELKWKVIGVAGSIKSYFTGTSIKIGPSGAGGSFAVGLDYVPTDNFPANLHRGEAVLTRSEAEEWRAGKDGKGTTINVYQSIYSEAKTAADLMREARWEQERGVMMGYVYG